MVPRNDPKSSQLFRPELHTFRPFCCALKLDTDLIFALCDFVDACTECRIAKN